ncbi:MAG: hypothetical protein WAL47_00255, partial [Pyrinomonadaceae bacterium]
FRRSLWIAIICLIFGCVFVDVAHFLVGWPGEGLVALPALLLIPIGLIVFAVSVFKDRNLWQRFLRQTHSLTLIVLCVIVGELIWMNLNPRVSTVPRFRRDDPIIKTTARGWPFPLHDSADITNFQTVFGLGPRESEYPLLQTDSRREEFMPWEYWLMNLLHWFLILFVVLLVCEGSYRRLVNDSGLPSGGAR